MKNIGDVLKKWHKRAIEFEENGKLHPKAIKKTPQNPPNTLPVEIKTKSSVLTLGRDKNSRESVIEIISDCYVLQKTFGMSADNLPKITIAFLKLFTDENSTKVVNAFQYHLKHAKEFPTPGDITALIERGNGKPALSGSVYIGLQNKSKAGCHLSEEEHTYIKDYEKQHTGD